MNPVLSDPSKIHPDLWRASQLGRYRGACLSTGSPELDAELPDGGWPQGALVDLLLQQHGIGEMRLLKPAIKAVMPKSIVLLNPPYTPNAAAFSFWGLDTKPFTWINAPVTSDCLWAAEQILMSGTCGALLMWKDRLRNEQLRRLQVAASTGTTLLFVLQPIYSLVQSSPASLRLVLKPALDGVSIEFAKRRGPARDEPLLVKLPHSPILTLRDYNREMLEEAEEEAAERKQLRHAVPRYLEKMHL